MTPYLLQVNLWEVQGPITVVGVLLVVVMGLYLGFITPKHSVEEIRRRLREREAENVELNANIIKRIEENAELRGQLNMLSQRIDELQHEVQRLRGELARHRTDQ